MSKEYKDITAELYKNLSSLRKAIPETMDGFSNLAAAATTDGELSKKTKELIAFAIGVAKQCDGCIGFHAQALKKLKASRQEVVEALGIAIYMGGGPALMYAADGLKAFDEFSR